MPAKKLVTATAYGCCDSIKNNAFKDTTNNVQPVNIYENEEKNLRKALISGGFPVFQAAVPTPISVWRRFKPHVIRFKFPLAMCPQNPWKSIKTIQLHPV